MRSEGTIADVVDRMLDIQATLPATDGVACFNRMYLRVTELVQDEVQQATFEDGAFLARLDVGFAHRFFDAYESDQRGEPVAPAWSPLFEHRHRRRIRPLQFALAGMNAHINYDLPVAVVATCRELGLEPSADAPQHRDFTRVNAILASVEGTVKRELEHGLAGELDEAAGDVDDAVEMWCISEARAVAWSVAETLWSLEDVPRSQRLLLAALARSVRLAGRGILV